MLLSGILCLVTVGCKDPSKLAVEQTPVQRTSQVIPLPEAAENVPSEPIDAIVVDKNGVMEQTQYPYDLDQGGVVINSDDEVFGEGASIFFPAFEVGLLWWGGYFVDNEGLYWNGHQYEHVQDPNWTFCYRLLH